MSCRCLLLASLLALPACGEGATTPPPADRGAPRPDLPSTDILPHFDIYAPPVDLRPDGRHDGGSSCTLGTADNCASCGDVCPPGKDSPSTARVCLSSTCDIQCKDESYDVNGNAADGCEAADDLPIHDSAAAAKDLGQATDCGNALTTSGVLPSDDRKHLVAPTDRPAGRADWYKLHIDDGWCVVEAAVKISLKSLPAAGLYRAAAYWVCDGGAQLATDSQTGPGGGELLLNPAVNCTTMGNDSGTLYIKIGQDSGAHSAASYTIEITP